MPISGPTTTRRNGTPRTLISAKEVRLALVEYADNEGTVRVQLAVVGSQNIHVLGAKATGFSRENGIEGKAPSWLQEAVIDALAPKKAESDVVKDVEKVLSKPPRKRQVKKEEPL